MNHNELPALTFQIPVTPIGPVNVAWTARGVVAVEIGGHLAAFAEELAQRLERRPVAGGGPPTPRGDEISHAPAPRQIQEYLAGERTTFDLDIDWALITPFQCQVLTLQIAIPYGETRTYGQLAADLGKPRAARAVGRAGATNPIPLIIPCHRVIGADGTLRGYGAPGGIQTKAWRLEPCAVFGQQTGLGLFENRQAVFAFRNNIPRRDSIECACFYFFGEKVKSLLPTTFQRGFAGVQVVGDTLRIFMTVCHDFSPFSF